MPTSTSRPKGRLLRHLGALFLIAGLLGLGCQKQSGDSGDKPVGNTSGDSLKPTDEDPVSKDILARTEVASDVDVKHVLISWKEMAGAYRGRQDPRGAKRTLGEANALALDLAKQIKANPDAMDALVKKWSEDPGSLGGDPYTVSADSPFVPEFKQLALRLQVKEVGIVKTNYGYHVMLRIAPPPPDPLESADILARPAGTEKVFVQHILIGWKDAPGAKRSKDPRTQRTKAEADKLAADILAKVRAGGDMLALMKEFSEDPGSKDDGKAYDVTPDSQLVPTFKALSLRLQMNEAGLVISPYGWHIIKRVPEPPPPPPPAPDALDSVDILARQPVTQKAKVKHILLGWAEVHADDPRGTARTRADLEKLVKETVAKLKKGAKIEALMKELSEDPGSAATGDGYDVTPDASLVEPFKNLSLRLKVGEVGVVKSQFGIHIIQRAE